MHDATDVLPWDDICFIDCETRSSADQDDAEIAGDVTNTSTSRYAENAWPIIITWGYGLEGDVFRWENPDITRPPTLDELPQELLEWDGYFAAWNSGFDRKILDRWLKAGVEGWLDMMAHAAYNNLPLSLDRAAKACGLEGKVSAGKALIKKFCSHDGALPEEEPEKWEQFLHYADVDVEQMQAVAAATFPVPFSIWQEFWVSETINDRGLPIDRTMAEGGARLAEQYAEYLGDRVKEISGGEMYSIKQYDKQRDWIWQRVRGSRMVAQHMIKAHRLMEPDEVRREIERLEGEIDELQHMKRKAADTTRMNKKIKRIAKIEAERYADGSFDDYVLEMDRPRITKMLAALETLDEKEGLTDGEYEALLLLTEREWGASAAPAKFQKMLDMALENDRLPNQYVFSGATQTGRYSSRGVQVHNMTRSTVGDVEQEEDAALSLIDGTDLPEFEKKFGNAGKTLSRLIRPTIVAEEGKVLVWGDWSSIEARALPWLAKAEHRLDVFREIDADPSSPDVYIRAVCDMYGHDLAETWAKHKNKDPWAKGERNKGKVAELALGFLGGTGALDNMAAAYGLAFEASESQDIVDRWREANQWAMDFGDECWEAFLSAFKNPGPLYHAGRVAYQGIDLEAETWVVCFLPDGRPLFYRNVRNRKHVEYDPFEPDTIIEESYKLSFEGEDGIKWIWKGILVENTTQAICVSKLRGTLLRLESPGFDFFETVGHTHDEIITQVTEANAEAAKTVLKREMLVDLGWEDGMPMAADITSHVWYSKAIED